MNPDKKKADPIDEEKKKSADTVETPPPPQHMDPSKNPEPEKDGEADSEKPKK